MKAKVYTTTKPHRENKYKQKKRIPASATPDFLEVGGLAWVFGFYYSEVRYKTYVVIYHGFLNGRHIFERNDQPGEVFTFGPHNLLKYVDKCHL